MSEQVSVQKANINWNLHVADLKGRAQELSTELQQLRRKSKPFSPNFGNNFLSIETIMIPDTVLIRHLPSSLSHKEKSGLLQHFGALDVKILGPETRKTNLVYARFKDEKAAEIAVHRLHQLDILGHRISAEIARGKVADSTIPTDVSTHNISNEKQDQILKAREAFLKRLGLSIKNYDFSQPPPLNIYYQYPPPNKLVLNNIGKAMASTPNFYNQVLHLMNKMNLPCPFTDKYPLDSDLFKEREINLPEVVTKAHIEEDQTYEDIGASENESEIGSETDQPQSGEIIPLKRKRAHKKVVKRRKFVKPQITSVQTSKTGLRPDDVFENSQMEQAPRKIELKISSDLSSIQVAQEIQAVENLQEGFKIIKAPQKPQEKEIDSENNDDISKEEASFAFITSEDLAANRVSAKDQRVLPVFKNYQAGAPSCRLYIKNLAKHVQTKDLHFIYRRYYRPELDQEQGSMFDVRLMQEGRMKGQAFITLQSVTQAQAALRETNGFILKDKPMVVQFARSAATK